eukprot:scpid24464/ scgid9651/ Sushi, von Willebrand factor type A, EGF and pentraxin domain-containing protein 1
MSVLLTLIPVIIGLSVVRGDSSSSDEQQRTCPKPTLHNISKETTLLDSYKPTQTINVTCKQAFAVNGQRTHELVCQTNGIWSPQPLPICELLRCPKLNLTNIKQGFNQPSLKSFYSPGEKATFRCRNGWRANNKKIHTLDCQMNGIWSLQPIPICERVKCPDLQFNTTTIEVVTADALNSTFSFQDKVKYRCARGYYFPKDTSREKNISCGKDTAWQTWETCEKIPANMSCPPPTLNMRVYRIHGTTDSEDKFFFYDTINYSCVEGFEFHAQAKSLESRVNKIHCTRNSTWSQTLPCHLVQCKSSTQRYLLPNQTVANFNESVTFTCKPGYINRHGRRKEGPGYTDSVTSRCQANGTWSSKIPDCRRASNNNTCPWKLWKNGAKSGPGKLLMYDKLGNLKKTVLIQSVNRTRVWFTVGGKGVLQCDNGYHVTRDGSDSHKGNSNSTCIGAYNWTNGTPLCVRDVCSYPSTNQNSPTQTYRFEDPIEYPCQDGYGVNINGTWMLTLSTTCQAYGIWHPPLDHCRTITCLHPPADVLHIRQTNKSEYSVNETAEFVCEYGYWLTRNGTGPQSQLPYCQANGTWAPTVVKCRLVTCPWTLPGDDSSTFANGSVEALQTSKFDTYTLPENSVSTSVPIGITLKITCSTGFTIPRHGKDVIQSECNASGLWSLDLHHIHCEEIKCQLEILTMHSITTALYVAKGDKSMESISINRTGSVIYPYSTQLNVMCKEGYQISHLDAHQRNFVSACLSPDGAWVPPIATCEEVTCSQPIINKSVHLENATAYRYNTTLSVGCQLGYVWTTGDTPGNDTNGTITCQATGLWSPGTCEVVICRDPVVNNTFPLDKTTAYTYNTTLAIGCQIGYVWTTSSNAPGNETIGTITCQETGVWSAGTCQEITCRLEILTGNNSTTTLYIDGGNNNMQAIPVNRSRNTSYPYSTQLNVMCAEGYQISDQVTHQGNLSSTCSSINGAWVPPVATCQEVTCNMPVIDDSFLMTNKTAYKYNTTLSVECQLGHVWTTNGEASTNEANGTIMCLTTGIWSRGSCEAITCPSKEIANSSLGDTGDAYYGENRSVFCNTGWFFVSIAHQDGENETGLNPKSGSQQQRVGHVFCEADRTWSPGFCSLVSCPTIPVSNAEINETGIGYFQDQINVTCRIGYQFVRSTTTTMNTSEYLELFQQTGKMSCLANQSWTPGHCADVVCPSRELHNADVRSTRVGYFSHNVSVTCNSGYEFTSSSAENDTETTGSRFTYNATLVCLSDSSWTEGDCKDINECADNSR